MGAVDVLDELVESGQQLARIVDHRCEHSYCAAQLSHRGRGAEIVAHDVADHETDPVVGQRDQVVPVAPDLEAAIRRSVRRAPVGAWDLVGTSEHRVLQ